MSKFRVAWFSELNLGEKSPSSAAYFTDEILPLLTDRFEIELFHDRFSSQPLAPTFHYLTAAKRHAEKPFDLFFYQLEDRKEAYFVRSHLGIKPGVVLFHDLLLKQDGPEPFHYSPWQKIAAKLKDNSLPWPKRGEFPDRLGPLAYREACFTLVPIFSNSRNLGEFRREVKVSVRADEKSDAPNSFYLPTPVTETTLASNSSGTFRVGFLGGPDIEYRAHKVLPALTALSQDHAIKLVWLIEKSEEARVKELISEFEFTDIELHFGRSLSEWHKLSASLDIALHPLFSVFGDPTPYVAISLMRGIPTIVTEFAASESLPDSVVLKVQAGEHESAEILRTISLVMNAGSEIDQLKKRARDYALEIHDSRAVARELETIFKMKLGSLRRFNQRWGLLEEDAGAALLEEALPAGDDISAYAKKEILLPAFRDLGWVK